MILSELRRQFLEATATLYDEREQRAMFRLYVTGKLNIPFYRFFFNLNEEWAVPDHFTNDLQRIRNGEPIQYIIGDTEFYNAVIQVNSSVLIPRPETEELVEWIVQTHQENPPKSILDIGTGSGNIAIALKKSFPEAKVRATDISESALQTACSNAHSNRVEIAFQPMNILETDNLKYKYDLIVSNPPYIPESEKSGLARNVVNFEPCSALFVPDDDPLIFYRKIAELAVTGLTSNGELYFETHEKFHRELKQLLTSTGWNDVVCKKDFRKLPRFARAKMTRQKSQHI